MLEKRVCDQKESEYEQKKDGVLERKYNDGTESHLGFYIDIYLSYIYNLDTK